MRWEGLEAYRDELRRLPRELVPEARVLIVQAAEGARLEADAGYARHDKSGNLRRGLVVRHGAPTSFGAEVWLINRAPHAWLFEHGSHGPRSYTGTDKRGRVFKSADRGTMPATPTFWPAVGRQSRRMHARLKDMLQRATGLQVVVSNV
jgi:hypothetical protein